MSLLLPGLLLLVATVAVPLAIYLWKRRDVWTLKLWKLRGSRARGSRNSQVAPVAPSSPTAPRSSQHIPCGCSSGCSSCATAAQEMQDLVVSEWSGVSFPLDPEVWQVLWEDLEKLLERGRLSCCSLSGSSSSCGSIPGAGDVGIDRTGSSLRMHVARKNLEVKMGARPVLVRRSQEQVAQQEISWSRRCPIHGSLEAAAVPYEKSLRAVLDKILQRQKNVSPPPGNIPEPEKQQDRGDFRTSNIPGKSLHPFHIHRESSPSFLGAVGTCPVWKTARKRLGMELGACPVPEKCSQEKKAELEVSRSRRRCPNHGARAVPYGKSLRAVLDRIIRRERDSEHPHPKGAAWRSLSSIGMNLVSAARTLQRLFRPKKPRILPKS